MHIVFDSFRTFILLSHEIGYIFIFVFSSSCVGFIRTISMNDSECLNIFITYILPYNLSVRKINIFPIFFFVINFGKELLNDSRIVSLSFDNEHYALNARLFLTSYLLFSR